MGTTVVIVIIIAVFVLMKISEVSRAIVQTPAVGKIKPIATVTYSCDKNKTITAAYLPETTILATRADMPPTPGGSVQLVLDDGRTMTLPQTISADGARFANTDDTFVFWNKGNGAMVLENGTSTTYMNCTSTS